jgi:ribosomal protein L32
MSGMEYPTAPYSAAERRSIAHRVRRIYNAFGSWKDVASALGMYSKAYWFRVARGDMLCSDEGVRAVLLYVEKQAGMIQVPVCPTCGGYHGPETVDCHGSPHTIMILHRESDAWPETAGGSITARDPGSGMVYQLTPARTPAPLYGGALTPIYERVLTPKNGDDLTPIYERVLTPIYGNVLTPKIVDQRPNMGDRSRLEKPKRKRPNRKNVSIPADVWERANTWRVAHGYEWSDMLVNSMENSDDKGSEDAGRNVVHAPGSAPETSGGETPS